MKKKNYDLFHGIRRYEVTEEREIRKVAATAYTVLDVETSGTVGDLTEIAALRVRDGLITATFQTLVKPTNEIKKVVKELTGITGEIVREAPTLSQVWPSLVAFLKKDILVGHSLDMDLMHLALAADQMGQPRIYGPYIDTNALAHRVLSEVEPGRKYSVEALCDRYHLPCHEFHRAKADCFAEKLLFETLVKEGEKACGT